jgi:hypothetical protein
MGESSDPEQTPPPSTAPATESPTPTAPSTDSTETDPTASPGASVGAGFEPLVRVAVADLASRLGVTEADVVVVSTEAVTWPDRSMGCPLPDMRYEQVPTDGALIVLSVDGVPYSYHSGGSRPPFLCTTKG